MSHADPTRRTHRASIVSSRTASESDEQVRSAKNARAAGRAAQRRAVRRTAADERTAFWRGLTPAQQIADLDARLGIGQGAARQRAKIAANAAH